MHHIPALLYYSTILLTNANAANILGLFPTASFSHQQPMLELSYMLGAKGHSLTILTTNPSKVPVKNVREIDISSLYKDWEKMQTTGVVSLQKRNYSKFKLIQDVCYWSAFVTRALIEKSVFKEFVREVNGTKFDLILYEPLAYSSLLGIREITGNPPVVAIMTLHPYAVADDQMGNPFIPSYIPSIFLDYSDRMNIWERFLNGYAELYSRYIFYTCTMPEQERQLREAFGQVKRTAVELEFDRSLLIVSVDFATGYPRPLQPNTVYVGPMHLKKPAPLPQDLQKFLDEAEDGVIYFSMGSNMKGTSIPEHIRTAFINAFRQFPKVRVLWKWESDTKLPGLPDNVLMKKWLPQISILGHPKTKVFISQCGVQSFQEAIDNVVPMMAIPIFGDQEFNSRRLVYTGAGLRLEFDDITFEEVYEKLKDLLTNESYRNNMKRLSSIAKDKPMPAVDTAVWWVEYVIRHNGAPHLRPAGLDLIWYQYYMLDILSILIILSIIVLYVVYYIASRLIWFLSSNVSGNIKKKSD